MVDGKPVDLYTIKNSKGMVVRITNYGARVEQILVPDRKGKLGDVALGYESLDQVMGGQGSLNAFIGRYANRIAKGQFTLDGQSYQIAINNPPNTLHGGFKGFDKVLWQAQSFEHQDEVGLPLQYASPDGEEGYPGT